MWNQTCLCSGNGLWWIVQSSFGSRDIQDAAEPGWHCYGPCRTILNNPQNPPKPISGVKYLQQTLRCSEFTTIIPILTVYTKMMNSQRHFFYKYDVINRSGTCSSLGPHLASKQTWRIVANVWQGPGPNEVRRTCIVGAHRICEKECLWRPVTY